MPQHIVKLKFYSIHFDLLQVIVCVTETHNVSVACNRAVNTLLIAIDLLFSLLNANLFFLERAIVHFQLFQIHWKRKNYSKCEVEYSMLAFNCHIKFN